MITSVGAAEAAALSATASSTGWMSVGERDDPEDLAGRRLLLQRLGELPIALLEFVEQPGVLDGDDGLIGEGLEQLDLIF